MFSLRQVDGQLEGTEDKRWTMPFAEIEAAIFSFQNIMKIDNLEGLANLTKLQLDNNVIEKIENLDHLVNLTRLDLSFNNIAKIEGLEKLTKITDLSLLNNRIKAIEGLDSLTDLNVLSIGNNQIDDLESAMYLRKFGNLRLVNLAGNPICQDPEYRPYVLSHLKHLKYLDYRLVDPAAVRAAREQYQDELMEIEENEAKWEEEPKVRREAERHAEDMERANLGGVEALFEDMLAKDPEYKKLKEIPNLLDTALAEFQEKFVVATEEVKTNVLGMHGKKEEEHASWKEAVREHTQTLDSRARNLILTFEHSKKHMFRELQADPGRAENKVRPLLERNESLKDELLELEVQTVTALTEMNAIFNREYTELVETNKQHYVTYFTQVRDLENAFFEAVTVQSMQLLEKYNSGELEIDDIRDDLRVLLQDKDTLLNSIQAMHDSHTTLIDASEDRLVTSEVKDANSRVSQITAWERQRNRSRITEIWKLFERNLTEIEDSAVEDVPE